MGRTSRELALKFSREWIEAKPAAIDAYVAVSSQLAQRTIDAKAKMITNFTAAMATTKFQDKLQVYVGNGLMGDAFSQALTSKTVITDAELLKVETDIDLKRGIAANIADVIVYYQDQDSADEVTVPLNVADQGLRAMLIQGINSNQYRLNAGSSVATIYENTKEYMKTNLGWPAAA